MPTAVFQIFFGCDQISSKSLKSLPGLRRCSGGDEDASCSQELSATQQASPVAPAVLGIWDPVRNVRKIPGNCSQEIPRSAQLEDGSRAFLPQRSSPSPSQRRQLDNFNYFDDGGIADRRCGSSAGPRPPRQCAKLTSQSSRQKRSGAGSPSNVWGKGSSSLLHLLSDCMQVD